MTPNSCLGNKCMLLQQNLCDNQETKKEEKKLEWNSKDTKKVYNTLPNDPHGQSMYSKWP